MEEILRLLSPYKGWAALAIAAFVLYTHRADLSRVTGWLRGTGGSLTGWLGTESDDSRNARELQALTTLRGRYKRLECSEGLEALRGCEREFFTDHRVTEA